MTGYKDQDDGYWFIYHLQIKNNTGATQTGTYKVRFYVVPENPGITIGNQYDESSNWIGDPTAGAWTLYSGSIYYYEVNFGSRSVTNGGTLGYKGELIETGGGNGFVSSNDWSSSQFTTTSATITHVVVYKDGNIIAGTQP